jgi:hypothetical protein
MSNKKDNDRRRSGSSEDLACAQLSVPESLRLQVVILYINLLYSEVYSLSNGNPQPLMLIDPLAL